MMNLREDILLHLKSHPFWEEFEKDVLSHRPQIPPFNPDAQNVEIWKKESGRQEGFDLCLILFQIEV
jgi:hypothetical protein